jgi:flagellar M-ring protein FliF
LNVAVVVNNMPETDKAGKVTYRPLTAAEKKQINDLAMQAMGFNKERGDSLTVVNSSFAGEPTEKLPEVPMWKNPVLIEYVKDILRLLAGVIGMLMLYKKILKPLFNKLAEPIALLAHNPDSVVSISGGQEMIEAGRNGMAGYDKNLGTVKQIAANNPRMVANVVAGWTNGTDK